MKVTFRTVQGKSFTLELVEAAQVRDRRPPRSLPAAIIARRARRRAGLASPRLARAGPPVPAAPHEEPLAPPPDSLIARA
jgi:hypothetical protein